MTQETKKTQDRKAYLVQWHKDHPEKAAQYAARHRLKKKGLVQTYKEAVKELEGQK